MNERYVAKDTTRQSPGKGLAGKGSGQPAEGQGRRAKPAGKVLPGAGAPGTRVKADGTRYTFRQPYAVKRKAVQLYLEEGLPSELVAQELGVTKGSVFEWVKQYREGGEESLKPKPRSVRTVNKLPAAVAAKIGELKREDPARGVRRISQILRRVFFLKASPETVRQQVKAQGLKNLPVPKARKKPKAPERRFERAAPDQLWQTDITYYPILGSMGYIIGFIDDHSRFITGLGLYRSQTGENVVETYRQATGTFKVPKELLSDNGRQYASWSGKTRFQKELAKDHVHHIRSAPHHPMTLGKIERFWQTLKDEFLSRARFETFEEARERLAYWVKYYNHRRPHQGLDGLTPADRYFAIQKQLREVMERQVAANVEELALRGKPVEPFYLVGRMGDKSVVIETDKRTVSMRVDGLPVAAGDAMVYDIRKEQDDERGNKSGAGAQTPADAGVQREGEEPGGPGVVERPAECRGPDEGTARALGHAEQLGEAGVDGDVDGAGPEVEAGGGTAGTAGARGTVDGVDIGSGAGNGPGDEVREGRDEGVYSPGEVPRRADGVAGTEVGGDAVSGAIPGGIAVQPVAGSGVIGYAAGVGTEAPARGVGGAGPAGDAAALAGSEGAGQGTEPGGTAAAVPAGVGEAEGTGACRLAGPRLKEVTGECDGSGSQSGAPQAGDSGGPGRPADGDGRSPGTRSQSQDVLRVAGAGTGRDGGGAEGSAGRPAPGSDGPGEGGLAAGTGGPGEGPADPDGAPAGSRSHPGSAQYVAGQAGGQ